VIFLCVSETTDAYVNGLYWTAVADGDKGLAVFNRGPWDGAREGRRFFGPLAYAAYYVWAPDAQRDFEYEFALYPFTGPWTDADLHRRAVEYNFPLVGWRHLRPTGPWGRLFSLSAYSRVTHWFRLSTTARARSTCGCTITAAQMVR